MNTDTIVKAVRKHMPEKQASALPENIAVISLSPAKSRELNNVYRGKNMPANVLSFRYDEKYGEILVCPAIIRQEAKTRGNSYQQQMTWMIVHGMLHLAGLHHETSERAALRVEKLEQQVLKKL